MRSKNEDFNAKRKQPLLEIENVTKIYKTGREEYQALQKVGFESEKGSFIAILGKSGSGKSTLLNLIGGIDSVTGGKIILNGEDISNLKTSQLSRFRAENIGFIFQFFQLIPTLTVFENVMLPMDFLGKIASTARRERAENLLKEVGIWDHAFKFPQALSGGEQQRVAIARALANDPEIILADEPTGNLDSQTSEVIFELLQNLVGIGKTVVMVTHDNELAKRCNRIIRIHDGVVLDDITN